MTKIQAYYGIGFGTDRHLVVNDLEGKSHDYGIDRETGIELALEILTKEFYPLDHEKWRKRGVYIKKGIQPERRKF